MLFEYFRKPKTRIKKGAMIAIPNFYNGCIDFGVSLCNTGLDEFDKDRAFQIARDRATRRITPAIPHSMRKSFACFKERSKKYYKQFTAE